VTPTSLALLFVLGLGLSAAPGALNVETVRRGMRHGVSSALTVQVGALLGDALWVAGTTAAVALRLHSSLAAPAFMALGGGALLWTAWRVWRPPGTSPAVPTAAPVRGHAPGAVGRGLVVGAVLALSSPLTLVFWAAVQAMLHEELGRRPAPTELALVCGAYMSSVLAWGLGLSLAAGWAGHLVGQGRARLLNLACAALLALWGVQLLGRAAAVLA
jgi:threonine/homoserine/homoserine lactone efflux protein